MHRGARGCIWPGSRVGTIDGLASLPRNGTQHRDWTSSSVATLALYGYRQGVEDGMDRDFPVLRVPTFHHEIGENGTQAGKQTRRGRSAHVIRVCPDGTLRRKCVQLPSSWIPTRTGRLLPLGAVWNECMELEPVLDSVRMSTVLQCRPQLSSILGKKYTITCME